MINEGACMNLGVCNVNGAENAGWVGQAYFHMINYLDPIACVNTVQVAIYTTNLYYHI